MSDRFEVWFLEDAINFIEKLDSKIRKKVLFNIEKAQLTNDPKLFKKLTGEIWEFRTRFNGQQFRLFAFWDKSDKSNTLVIATHGIVKKSGKITKTDLNKAERIRQLYIIGKTP